MQITYCDLCGLPLKDKDFFLFYIIPAKQQAPQFDNIEDYSENIGRISKEIKEVCPSCKHIIERIFELRFNNLRELESELLGIYEKQPKEPHKKDKQK
jgi:hypothetical protein